MLVLPPFHFDSPIFYFVVRGKNALNNVPKQNQ